MRKTYLDYAKTDGLDRDRLPKINLITYPILGNKHAWLVLGAFVAGQLVQLVFMEVSSSLSMYYHTRFCWAAGFIIAFVLFAGMFIDARTRPENKQGEDSDENKAD